MSLFSIETAPVPLDAETYLGEKREYTQIIPETELIALAENNYIPLTQAQASLCAKIGYMYYCEYAHLLKKLMEHTCMSAIYCDQSSNIKVKQCKTIITFDTILESKILDAGNLLILSNLQKPWTILKFLYLVEKFLADISKNSLITTPKVKAAEVRAVKRKYRRFYTRF